MPLGATAAQALLGDDVRVTRDEGKPGFIDDLRVAARAAT